MEEEPERLAGIKGISEKMAMAIAEQVEEKRDMRQAMMFLQGYGISMNLAAKIYQEYGPAMYGIIRQNPYKLADDIPGVGFKMADEIAAKVGIFTDSDFRIKSGILYTLLKATAGGHTYLPKEVLCAQASELLGVKQEEIEKHLADMQMDKRLVIKYGRSGEESGTQTASASHGETGEEGEEGPDSERERPQLVYDSQYYYTELNTTKMLHDLNITGDQSESPSEKSLGRIQEQENIELDRASDTGSDQRAVNCRLLVITGAPEQENHNHQYDYRYFRLGGLDILLAAPAGRAAKRMTEATGCEAKTIHRLLELTGAPLEEKGNDAGQRGKLANGGMRFERNEDNPLDADVIIIDEMSMVDIHLMHSLLRAVNVGTRLILVGDVDQLPSVGPGNVLRDIIESGCFHVSEADADFPPGSPERYCRQCPQDQQRRADSPGKEKQRFSLYQAGGSVSHRQLRNHLVKDKLPGYVKADVFDIQIAAPYAKGRPGGGAAEHCPAAAPEPAVA